MPPLISFIIATHNRREALLDTLGQLADPAVSTHRRQVIVVNNASRDGTAMAVASRFPEVILLDRTDNLGSCAKAVGEEHALGEYTVFLDDDSHPRAGCVERTIAHFERNPRLGAASCVAHLPDGSRECSAFPNVFIGCGVGFRSSALREVGGLDEQLFMQAEEYDLSFRLINAGWQVETFSDLHVEHQKTRTARVSERTAFHDARNNLLIVERYLPDPLRAAYRSDWLRRYQWLAEREGHKDAYTAALAEYRRRRRSERSQFRFRRLSASAVETLFRLSEIESRMRDLKRSGVSRIVLADWGKNVYAFLTAARAADMHVSAVADDRFAVPRRRYRGIRIIPTACINTENPDAVVISNTSPVHAELTERRLASLVDAPVFRWFGLGSSHHRQTDVEPGEAHGLSVGNRLELRKETA